MEWVIHAITAVRAARSELNVPVAAIVQSAASSNDMLEREYLERNQPLIERLARITLSDMISKPLSVIVDQTVFQLNIRDVIDLDAEHARLQKEKAKLLGDLKVVTGKLSNAEFVAKAPQEIIDENKARELILNTRLEKIEAALLQLT
jgi:valyl-tRNA synthetase